MNKLAAALAGLTTLLILQACKSSTKKDSVAKADSFNAVKDTTRQLSIAVEKVDADFAVEATSGGLAEVVLGKLAQQKGVNRRVKNFGTMMVKDHSSANELLRALAVTKNISIPKTPGAGEQKVIDKLSKKSGADFDKAYVNNMIEDHQNDIKEFEKAAKNCVDPDVKSFAAKTLPILQAHLDAINAIKDSMK